jgi:hypothetical protein
VERCWDADPEKRPTFEGIINEMNANIVVDCAVFSGKGRKFWKLCYYNSEELQEEVSWQSFLDNFCLYFAENGTVLKPNDPAYKCLRQVFCVNDLVTLGGFGRMLGFFTPLEKGEWLSQLQSIFREPWFWGDTSREIACQKLAPEQRGTFLVRYASEDSYFTISYVALNQQNKKEIFHTRVVHNYASTHFVIPTSRAGSRTCSSLQEVVFALKEGTSHLVHKSCPGGPYCSFFQENNLDSGYGYVGGYQVADVQPDFEESDEFSDEAITGNLKESQQVFPKHLMKNNSGRAPPPVSGLSLTPPGGKTIPASMNNANSPKGHK